MAIHFFVPILAFFFNLFFAVLSLHCSAGVSPTVVSRGSSLWCCAGFPLLWFLLLRSTDSRHLDLSGCSLSPQQLPHRLQSSAVVARRFSCSEAFGIFPDQGVNPCLRWILQTTEPQEKPPDSLFEVKGYRFSVKLWYLLLMPELNKVMLQKVKFKFRVSFCFHL